MTDQHKENDVLNEYLDDNSRLSKEYQKQEQHQPSAEMDELIISTARNETKKPGRNNKTWLIPTAIAATLVLSFSLVQLQKPAVFYQEKEMDVAVLDDKPEKQLLEKKKEHRVKQDMQASSPVEEQIAAREAPAPATAIAGFMMESEPKLAKNAETTRLARTADKEEALLPESKWLEKINQLLKEKKLAEAKQEYERFIKAYPKFIPDTELKQRLNLEE
ncbi:MAG: hypothetical protein P8Y24_06020 [Gammaproteobacteria bacterium]